MAEHSCLITAIPSNSINETTPRRLVENFRLLCLMGHLDDSDEDLHQLLTELKRVIHTIDIVTNADECLQFLDQNSSEQIVVVVPGSLGQHTVPSIHHLAQVHSIHVYCQKKSRHQAWIQAWPKVKSLSNDLESLRKALHACLKQGEQELTPISVMTSDQSSSRDLDQLDPSFMYTQLFKEIILENDDDNLDDAVKKLVIYCRHVFAGNVDELKKVDQFEREFHDHTPIWWYTYESFLYRMLNRSLRLFEPELLLKLGFFIRCLHRHIEELHRQQSDEYRTTFHVYRGQSLSKASFEKLTQSKGGILSFNNFLSTSKVRQLALGFAYDALGTSDSVGLLFTIAIDPNVSSSPFASVHEVSFYKDAEQEILISMNTVFRIGTIEPIGDSNRLWQVQLTLTEDNDTQLSTLLEQLRQETKGINGWDRLARLMSRIGRHEKAEEFYQQLLALTENEIVTAYFHHQLASIKYHQGLYPEAIQYNEKALEIRLNTLPSDHPQVALSYGTLGAAYHSQGNYPKAVFFYEQALAIREKVLSENHPDLARSYNNIALLYLQLGDHSKSLSFFQKSLRIDEANLAPLHPSLALTYNNMGGLYEQMADYSQSMAYFQKALEIRQRSLPSDHPDLAESYHNIASVYLAMGDVTKALEFHQQALEIRQKILPSAHPDLGFSYSNLGLVYDQMLEYEKALECHQNALDIRQKSLRDDHPDLATSYHNMATIYLKTAEYSKAVSFADRAVNIAQKSLPHNHPNIQLFRTVLDVARDKV